MGKVNLISLIESMAKKIERIYGVETIFEDDSPINRLSTSIFNIDDNMHIMMKVFKQSSVVPFEFTIDRDWIFVKSA